MSVKRARELVYARSGGVCEVCPQRRAAEWHHRKNRSQGGLWTPSNGLHLCSPCHRNITEHPNLAYSHGWSVRGATDPAAMPADLYRGWRYLHDNGTTSPADMAALEHLLGIARGLDGAA